MWAAFSALDQEEGSLDSIPLDRRELAHQLFKTAISNHAFCPRDALTTNRVTVLVNTGAKGTGKTTLQGMELYWFSKMVHHSIGLGITFNEDQGCLTTERASNPLDGKLAVGLRILHRVLSCLLDKSGASIAIDNHGRQLGQLLRAIGKECIVQTAVGAARLLLGAPPETKVLLVVDELAMACVNDSYTPSMFMRGLCSEMDAEQWLYLSLSAYKAVDMQKFQSDSGRAIVLLPLPPIFPVCAMTEAQCSKLPAVVRLFADEKLRRLLSRKDEAIDAYLRVARLLACSGGHPRRVAQLLNQLHSIYRIEGAPDPKKIVNALREALGGVNGAAKEEQLRKRMDAQLPWHAADVSTQLCSMNALLPQVIRDIVRAFLFPQNQERAADHFVLLEGASRGLWQFLPVPGNESGFLFCPLLVLSVLPRFLQKKEKVPLELRLSFCALVETLCSYCGMGPSPGAQAVIPSRLDRSKLFERLVYHSISMHILAKVSPPKKQYLQLCEFFPQNAAASPLSSIVSPLWTDQLPFTTAATLAEIEWFPLFSKAGSQVSNVDNVESLLLKFKASEKDVVLFMPKAKDNPSGDFFILLRLANPQELLYPTPGGQTGPAHWKRAGGTVMAQYILVVVQVKEWLFDANRSCSVEDAWRLNQRPFLYEHYGNNKSKSTPSGLKNQVQSTLPADCKTHGVFPLFALFTANPLEPTNPLLDPRHDKRLTQYEAVGCLDDMRKWLPTAAYNAQGGHFLRAMFGPLLPDNEAGSDHA